MSQPAPARLAERPHSGASTASPDRIGILAGGGRLPLTIAESVIERGGSVHIVAIEGEADPAIARFPHTWVNWGQVGRMVSTLRKHADALVIVGGVRRPDLWKLRPDWGFFVSLPRILEMMAGGDDSVLSRVVRFFEAKGIAVRGAHEVAPDLLAPGGPAGALSLDRQGLADAELGFAVRAALGALDAGQAVVTEGGRVLAIEGAEGTDAMLRRVADLRGGHEGASRSGVLAKGPKPGQELRVDMPTVGPRTIDGAAAAGLAGVAIEAGAVLLLDRPEAVKAAAIRGIAIEGITSVPGPAAKLEPGGADGGVPSSLVGEGQGGEGSQRGSGPSHPTPRIVRADVREGPDPHRGLPPTPDPSARGGGEPRRGSGQRVGDSQGPTIRVVGTLRPDARAAVDIEKGLAAIERLAPFETGKAVVVARAYILAIAAAESAFAMLERTRALRQWGVRAKRRVGVVVCRAEAGEWDAASVALLLERAATQGLSGVAVTGPAGALAPFAGAGGSADEHGLVLAMREEHS
jgi:UDP-2,3-diacylglucosamine hydrolase